MPGTHRLPRILLMLLLGIPTASCGDGAEPQWARNEKVPKLKGPQLVPQELVAALLTGLVAPGSTVPEIFVGRVPDDVPFEVPRPGNARVVGAVARPSFGTIVFAVPERPLEAIKAYRELLRRSGWDDPGREHGSGFQPSPVLHSGTFCQGEKRSISTAAAERSERETFLQVRYSESAEYSACDDRQRENMAPPRAPMPTLYPPPGTRILDGNVGGSRNYMEASARLRTALRPTQLIGHYAEQLRGDGWVPRSEPASGDVSAQTWRIEDRRGRAWVGLLVAVAIPDSEDREMLFRVMTPESNR